MGMQVITIDLSIKLTSRSVLNTKIIQTLISEECKRECSTNIRIFGFLPRVIQWGRIVFHTHIDDIDAVHEPDYLYIADPVP